MAVEKITNGYLVDGEEVSMYVQAWNHAEDRILAAKRKSKNDDEFKAKMITRLKRITQKTKLYYSVAVLYHHGYEEIANMYSGRIIMDKLTDEF